MYRMQSYTDNNRPYRLAVLISHPIQYQVPLFRALAKRPEIDLTVLFCSDWGLKPYHDEGFGQEVKWDIPLIEGYYSEFLSNISPWPSLSTFWGLINPAIIRHLRSSEYDAVLIHGWARFTYWLTMLTAFVSDIPVLMRGETNSLIPVDNSKAALKRFILTRLFDRTSAFLSIGRHSAEFYRAYGAPQEKIYTVPYAVDNEFFLAKAKELLPKKLELKEALGIPADLPVVLFTGKLIAVKRPLDLLMAFSKVSRKVKSALVFVGAGPLRDELEEYVRAHNLQHVYFMGFQNQTDIPKFYSLADVFVLPSNSETWGLVVNEAMCFGLPIVLSDCVGAGGNLVEEEANGLIYPVGDTDILAKRLERLLSNEDLKQKMGEVSRLIISRWTFQQGVEEILTCLKSLRLARPQTIS